MGEPQPKPQSQEKKESSPTPDEVPTEGDLTTPPAEHKEVLKPPKVSVPFPNRVKNEEQDMQFSKFLTMFRKLHINIHFAEAIAQMPKYAKFLKDIISNKKKLADFETIGLSEECSAVVLRKLPPKLKDPGSFTIPCTIGQCYFEKALCDLGASVNLMPYSVFRKLGMDEPEPTNVTLQLADRSIAHPRGVVEDVLVKVDTFIFPADFVVLDMEEDADVPIILGRPFLNTSGALIDVRQRELILRMNEEKVVFRILSPPKNSPSASCKCVKILNAKKVETLIVNEEEPLRALRDGKPHFQWHRPYIDGLTRQARDVKQALPGGNLC